MHSVSIVRDISKSGVEMPSYVAEERVDYNTKQLNRSVINPSQIKEVVAAYMNSIYTDLYPDREENWKYIPKTLIFAKDDNHATQIVNVVREVFKEKFKDGKVPAKFVQKITYSAGDSNALIRDLRTEKDFRIAVTVTLVATGTDVKPLEVVFFMNDVQSEVLYTQMKGRGCRVINDDKLKEVLILKYWYLLSRRDIAKILNVSEKTITNWKNKAFKLIKNYKERRLECDIRGP